MLAQIVSFFGKIFLPSNVNWKIKTTEKKLFLTFDDGPIPEVTPEVLGILKKYNAKATFFCVGENVQKHPDVFKHIIAEGHGVGNHSFNHIKANKFTNEEYLANVAKANELIQSPLFRPPYGRITPSLAKKLGEKYRIYMWSVLTRDYEQNLSPEACLRIALNQSKKGSIIVFHDSMKASKNMLYALPRVLEYFGKKGYIFEKLY